MGAVPREMYPPVQHPWAVAAAPPVAPPYPYVPPPAQTKRRGPLFAGLAIGLVALVVILVIVLKPKPVDTPGETDQQKLERLKQEALKELQQKDEQERKE